jgi:hypothetical protein
MTGARDAVVINAAWGLGESVVAGLITPDTFVFVNGKLRRHVNDKHVMAVPDAGGVTQEPVSESLRNAAALSDAEATELAELGRWIEALCGTPMDIEWAVHDGQIAILRARPITGLPAGLQSWNDSLRGDYLWDLREPAGSRPERDDTRHMVADRGARGTRHRRASDLGQHRRPVLSQRQYGHEFEISTPRPGEDPAGLKRLTAGRPGADDPAELLAGQAKERDAAWRRLRERHPRKVAAVSRRLAKAATAARKREQARSEFARCFWVFRALCGGLPI